MSAILPAKGRDVDNTKRDASRRAPRPPRSHGKHGADFFVAQTNQKVSDEVEAEMQCELGHFKCMVNGSKLCISDTHMCNGEKDCDRALDERVCTGHCSPGWERFRGKCYRVPKTRVNKKTEAQKVCAKLGAKLALPTDEPYTNFLLTLARGEKGKRHLWIDAEYHEKKKSWVNGENRNVRYTPWQRSGLNGSSRKKDKKDNCVAMIPKRGMWRRTYCKIRSWLYFACEGNKDSVSTCRGVDGRANDHWCNTNCNLKVPYCPADHCECDEQPRVYKTCTATDENTGDIWCNRNCNHVPPFCPESKCVCNEGLGSDFASGAESLRLMTSQVTWVWHLASLSVSLAVWQ